jgi:hypothetical protein
MVVGGFRPEINKAAVTGSFFSTIFCETLSTPLFRKFERISTQFPPRLDGSLSQIRRQGLGNSMKCDSLHMRWPWVPSFYPLDFLVE